MVVILLFIYAQICKRAAPPLADYAQVKLLWLVTIVATTALTSMVTAIITKCNGVQILK